ncbi:hypothetical protein ACFWP0_25935 [Achromobacter sp. NPDC058515]|uniref:hypothetical protein n=1 Tax=Achromobacter sp. NPDC058515 TaxID=3346533 RepID=UPI00364CD812
MDQDIGYLQYLNNGAKDSYRLSWTAYVIPTLFVLFCWSFTAAIYDWKPWAGVAFFVFWLFVWIGGFLSRRAVKLYLNDQGIWVSVGILPWTKGTNGVHWRDVDSAYFLPGFFAWAFKSYRIWVDHRFTKTREISLGSVANGNRFVEAINRRLMERQRSEAPDAMER